MGWMGLEFKMNLKEAKSKVKRSIKFFFQRLVRGWDDSDTWNLDCTLAKLITPRLKKFKDLKKDWNLTDLSDSEWNDHLDKMIAAFEFLGSEERWESTDKNKWKEVQEGLDLFHEHYFNLWW
jgi:hypothetical protein